MKTMYRIFKRLHKHLLMILLAIVLTVAQCGLELYLPYLMAEIINNGVLAGNGQVISDQGKIMLAACLLMGAVGYGTSLSCAYVSQKFAVELRRDLYRHVSTLSLAQVESIETGALISRITADVASCATFVNVCIVLFVEPLLMMLGGIYMMWLLATQLSAVFAIFVAVQMTVMFIFMKYTAPKFLKVQGLTDGINSRLQTTFTNFRLIKGYTTEDMEKGKFFDANDNLFKTAFDVQKLLAIFNPIVMLVMNLAVAYILYYAGVSVSEGRMPVGNVVAAITYSEQILLSIMVSGKLIKMASEAVPSTQRLCEVFDLTCDMPDEGVRLTTPVQTLACENLAFAYPESSLVVEDCSFSIQQGEFVALCGTVGAGKSTFTSLLGRFYDPAQGRVLIDGVDAKKIVPEDIHRRIAVVERTTDVFEGTFADNITFGRDYVTQEDITRAARAAQCEEFILRQPDGYDTMLVSLGKSISGGEKQRLVIARALAGKPDFLILDDSTAAMDYKTEGEMIAAIHRDYPAMAILLVTHRLHSAKKADRIAVFGEKRILDTGTDAALRQRCEAYQALCASQESKEVAADA